MPYCPKCRTEYRPGFIVCADCGVTLVDVLPEEPPQPAPGEPPVVIYETGRWTEAEVLKAKLESYGIPAALTGETAQRTIWNPSDFNIFGPVRIVVPADRAEEAHKILEGDGA